MTRYEGTRLVIEATAFTAFVGRGVTVPVGAFVFALVAVGFTVAAAVMFAARETT